VIVLVGQQQQYKCLLSADSKQYAVKIVSEQLCVCVGGAATAVGMMIVIGL